MPDLWQSRPAAFGGPPAAEGPALVERRGKLFELGTWEQPGRAPFSLTEQEADAAIAAFQGADLELEHLVSQERPTILDGALGRLTRIWREGRAIFGEVAMPGWADALWGRYGRKISAAFDPPTKHLLRAGLVVRPYFPDAAMFAAAGTLTMEDSMNILDFVRQRLAEAGINPAQEVREQTQASTPPAAQFSAAPPTPEAIQAALASLFQAQTVTAPISPPAQTFTQVVPAPQVMQYSAALAPPAPPDPAQAAMFARLAQLEDQVIASDVDRDLGRLQAEHRVSPAEFGGWRTALIQARRLEGQRPATFSVGADATGKDIQRTLAQHLLALLRDRAPAMVFGEELQVLGATPLPQTPSEDEQAALFAIQALRTQRGIADDPAQALASILAAAQKGQG